MTGDHERIGQVGCIDGLVLDVSRHGDEVILEAASVQVRLSTEAANRLADLLAPGPSELTQPTPFAPVGTQDQSDLAAEIRPGISVRDHEDAPDLRSILEPEALGTPDTTRSEDSQPLSRRRTHYGIRVSELLDAGLVAADEQLTWTQRRSGPIHRARILSDGQIQLEDGSGRQFHSPSPAAEAASGLKASPGWDVWRVADGRTLADLRNELIEQLSQHR